MSTGVWFVRVTDCGDGGADSDVVVDCFVGADCGDVIECGDVNSFVVVVDYNYVIIVLLLTVYLPESLPCHPTVQEASVLERAR